MTKIVSQAESRYGTPEPQIALRFPKGTSYRVVKAALHKLAAEIELATPASERWCVNTEDFNESGRVYLELADATPAEAARGISLRIVTGNCYGEERIQLLNRTRILVMLHQYRWSPAWIRFGFAAQCGACVVSEPMVDTQPFQADVHYAAAPAAQLPEVIQRLLRDDVERGRLVSAAEELCRTSLTLHHSVRQIAEIVTRSMNP